MNVMQYSSGLEVAAFGVGKGEASSVDVVGQSPTPFARVFGAAIGARMTKVICTQIYTVRIAQVAASLL